jgi:hypothetical protein
MKLSIRTTIAAMVMAVSAAVATPVSAGIFSTDAAVASKNLSKAAENFEVMRRVVFMNGITDTYMLEIIGYCSIEDRINLLAVTCMTDESFKKHYLGLSDNVTYFVEQMEPSKVSRSHYRVTFKPQAIIPDIDFRWDQKDLTTNHSEENQ